MYINKFMTMAQLLRENPDLIPVIDEIGLGCAHCLGKIVDTVERAAAQHGLEVEELLAILRGEDADQDGAGNFPDN